MHYLTINHFLSVSKNKQEVYQKFVEMSRNDEYTTGNLSDYLCHQSIINSMV